MIPETMAAIIKPCAGKGLELVTRPVPHPGAETQQMFLLPEKLLTGETSHPVR